MTANPDRPGAKAWTRGIIPSATERAEHDYYVTHPSAVERLLVAETFRGLVWEPSCGEGSIVRVLEAHRLRVRATDLVDRGCGEGGVDFLAPRRGRRVANVVTNPPFTLAEEFALRALEVTERKVALLCRLAWLEGQRRRAMFEATPLARVHVFSKRVAMARNGVGMATGLVAFAWFVWEHGHEGPPTLGWI